jgi:superfamily I DNA/RNA helicase
MAAGATASPRIAQARDEALTMIRRARQAGAMAQRYEAASAGERRVAAALLTLTATGWRLLVHRRWPGAGTGEVDMILIGPGGVFVVDVKNWRDGPGIARGHLTAGDRDRQFEVVRLLEQTRVTEDAVGSLGLSPVAVQPVLVFAAHRLNRTLGRALLLGQHDVGAALVALPRRLTPAQVKAVAGHLAEVFPDYRDTKLADQPEPAAVGARAGGAGAGVGAGGAAPGSGGRAPDAGWRGAFADAADVIGPVPEHFHPAPDDGADTGGADPDIGAEDPLDTAVAQSLFDVDLLRAAALESAMAAPIEGWMTFLHPDQAALVRRTFHGPARVSGAAGTGKTVVGLHRAVYLAQRSSRPVLFVTFVNNLPRVQQMLARRLAPAVADRIEFSSLHTFANNLLAAREVPVRLRGDQAASLLGRAWQNVGRHSGLAHIEPNPNYWFDEINYVIKGRGIATVDRYIDTERRGRRTALRVEERRAVWALYEEYERLRTEAGIRDFNDVLAMALAELERRPLEHPYAAVIADEVQDLTLMGVRLLHALVGDAPNGLMLIGDGQQAVYPGGYRLSEAGIAVSGSRGVVLGTNYRNAEEILASALHVVAADPFDDIDESTARGGREVETVFAGGMVSRVEVPTVAEHDRLLIAALQELMPAPTAAAVPAPWPGPDAADPAQTALGAIGDAAVLCASHQEVDRYHRMLTKAGIPVQRLENYDGTHTAACKLGTYHRVKGLEFKHVFLPRYDLALREAGVEGASAQERGQLARRRLFVAMTRARDHIWLGTVTAHAAASQAPSAPGPGA